MKKLANIILIAMAGLVVACHKNAELTHLQPVAFSGALTASTNSVVITPDDTSSTVLTLNWPAVTYPYKAKVTYTLQFDIPSDTLTATPWSNAQSVTVGQDILTRGLTGTVLNNLAINAGIPTNDTGRLVIRVQAYQDRYAYSKPVTVGITTYKLIVTATHGWPILYVPGDYQGWVPSSAQTVAAEQTNIYDGYVYFASGGTYQFKFTSDPDFNHTNYGLGASAGTLSTDGTAGNLTVPGPGYYELVANTSTLTYSATLTTWSIIGDATPGGWTTDTEMSYSATTGLWTVTCAMTTGGSFKFRANDAWSIDFGVDANNALYYADNPVYPYNGSLNNLTVPSSGNYTITLDLRNPNNYNYTLKKN